MDPKIMGIVSTACVLRILGECSTTSRKIWHNNYIHTKTNKHTTYSMYITNSTVSAVSMSIQTQLKCLMAVLHLTICVVIWI